jgi:hypothetical protein
MAEDAPETIYPSLDVVSEEVERTSVTFLTLGVTLSKTAGGAS